VDIDMAQLELDKLIIHFAQTNRAEGKSGKTISWYSEMLKDFTRYLELKNNKGLLSDFSVEAVREFIVYEQDRGMSPYTVQGKTRSLKAFASWLDREGYTKENLLTNYKLPKVPIILIEPLTNTEINQLVNYQNPLTALGCRNIAILILMLDTGIRLSELCSLHFENSHIEQGYLKILGKGSKERVVPVGALAQKMLWRYIIHFRPDPLVKANDYLFLALVGNPLQTNAVKLLFNRWGKKAGVPRLHAHLLRHTFATNFLVYKCGDVFRLQQILGHSSLEMVRRYVHYASTQALINGNTLSPVDQMGVRKLRGYKIDRIQRKTNHPNGKDRYG
jgi:integrase/recombinase XerC/integrase/recombinase XerD